MAGIVQDLCCRHRCTNSRRSPDRAGTPCVAACFRHASTRARMQLRIVSRRTGPVRLLMSTSARQASRDALGGFGAASPGAGAGGVDDGGVGVGVGLCASPGVTTTVADSRASQKRARPAIPCRISSSGGPSPSARCPTAACDAAVQPAEAGRLTALGGCASRQGEREAAREQEPPPCSCSALTHDDLRRGPAQAPFRWALQAE